jgi:hypothetical protein
MSPELDENITVRPGNWTIYPEALASAGEDVRNHAMVWFDGRHDAEQFAAAESVFTGTPHVALLLIPPHDRAFIAFRRGIAVKVDDAQTRKTIGRLSSLERMISDKNGGLT